MTPFETKCKIIGDMCVFLEEELSHIWEHYNLATTLAWSISVDYVLDQNSRVEELIEELFDVILAECEVEKDTGFSSYGEIYGQKGDSED